MSSNVKQMSRHEAKETWFCICVGKTPKTTRHRMDTILKCFTSVIKAGKNLWNKLFLRATCLGTQNKRRWMSSLSCEMTPTQAYGSLADFTFHQHWLWVDSGDKTSRRKCVIARLSCVNAFFLIECDAKTEEEAGNWGRGNELDREEAFNEHLILSAFI